LLTIDKDYFCASYKIYFLNNFEQLGLSPKIIEVLDKLGFTEPTPVQAQAIPLLLQSKPIDFIGLAQTGTGKTAAFGLPLIDLIDQDDPSLQALILAPTRELGQQTALQLKSFCSNNRSVNIEVVYGGAAITNQIKALKRPTQIVVATPGRLIDLIKRKAIRLDNVRYVVLDEADEMLNMGFKEDIDEILAFTKENRVTWLFSATMPSEIRRIVKKYMDAPVEVSINSEQKSNIDITHQYVVTKTTNKLTALRRFLDLQPEMRGVLFCRTKRETQEIADELISKGYGAEALHGDLSQGQRDTVMKRFKTRSMQLLVATDVAARGIDVNDLTHVIHHTLPDQLESYTHRSGRTGRAGKKGISLAFINPRESRRIQEIERRIKVSFAKIEVPTTEELKSRRINNWANLIVNTTIDEQSASILNRISEKFEDLSKEDLLKRLITTQLDHLMISDDGSDLNESGSSSSSNKSERSGGRSTSNFHRYFINIGSIDGMTNADLVHYISDTSGIDRKFIGDISLQKTCSYFDVEGDNDKDIEAKFKGLEIDGRELRVNRDDDGGVRDRRSSGGRGKGGFKPNSRPKNFKSGDSRKAPRRRR